MNKLIKNGLALSVLTVATLPLSYVIRLILSKNLTLEEFGLFFAMISFFSILQSFNDFGFSETQLYFIPKFIEQGRLDKIKATIKTQLINQVVTTFVIGLILTTFAQWFSTTIFHYPEATTLFRLFVLYFIFNDFLQNTHVLFFSHQETAYHGSQEPVRILLSVLLLLIATALFTFDLLIVTWIWVGVYAVLAISYFVLFILKHPELFRASSYSPLKIYKEFIPFLLPTILSNNAGLLFSRGTETFLAIVKGVADVGLYNIAKPISNLALAITSPIAQLLKPYISQVHEQKNVDVIRNIILTILNSGVFLLIPFFVILIFYSKESIVFLFGDQFIAASMTLKIISFEIFFNIMNTFIFGIVFGLGLQKSRAKIIYLSSFASLILSLILIPRFGPVGVALANLAYAVIALSGGIYIIREKIYFDLPIKNYIKIFALLLILVASQFLLKLVSSPLISYQFALFFIKAGIGLGIYFALGIFVFKIVELKSILNLLEKKLPEKIKNVFIVGNREVV